MIEQNHRPLYRDDGKRLDGRDLNDMRPITIKTNVLERADGSCYLTWGNNKIICAVFGPREIHPRHLAEPDRAIVRVEYRLATFSVGERKSPAPKRREYELSKVIAESLTPVLFLEKFPGGTIDVYITVLDADGGTRCASLTAACVAIANAGIPMKGLVAGCAVGKVEDKIVVDLSDVEDKEGHGDLPMSIIGNTETITLLQCDGQLSLDEAKEAIQLGIESCDKVYDLQREGLIKKYSMIQDEYDIDQSDEEE
jgi:exosome complex component RRP41